MSVHAPPPLGGPKRKPWKKSDLPGHHKPGHSAPKESAGKKALGVLKAASEKIEKPGKVFSASKKIINKVQKKHKVKILAALGLAGGLLVLKGGSCAIEAAHDAYQDHEQNTATEQAREAPQEHISVPLTMSIDVDSGQPAVSREDGVTTDDCGESHVMTVKLPAYDASKPPAPGTAISQRKGRMSLPKGSVKITVTAHGQTLTYESDADIVIDGEARDYSIDATLTKAEPAP